MRGARVRGNGRPAGAACRCLSTLDADGGLATAAAALTQSTRRGPPLIVRDVELMRRLYRSGESEYLIDGEICRLRDVQDLLMDAGLGVKAYAVIEQGKIGQILSARPTDRRQLIEEAAGVTKYKSRRRAAELKLEAAQQNLTRVDDIVFEVEKQRGALKRQAAKARRYKRLREELRRWEKVQFARRYRAARRSDRGGPGPAGGRADARDRRRRALAELETTLERLRLELTEADARDDGGARGRARQRARESAGCSSRSRSTSSRSSSSALRRRRSTPRSRARGAPRAGARSSSRRAARPRRTRVAERDTTRPRRCAAEEAAYADVQRHIEGLEADVEAARSEVFAAVNAATALRHAMEHAGAARERIGEQLAKLEVEERRSPASKRARRAGPRAPPRTAWRARARRWSRCASIAPNASRSSAPRAPSARAAPASCARWSTSWPALSARLKSLEELDAARAEYGDGARLILAEAPATESHTWARSPTTSKSTAVTSARSKPPSASCCSTWSSRRHDQAAAGIRLASRTTPAASDSWSPDPVSVRQPRSPAKRSPVPGACSMSSA